MHTLKDIDNLIWLDDGEFEVTAINGDISIHKGIISRVYIPTNIDTIGVFYIDYTN